MNLEERGHSSALNKEKEKFSRRVIPDSALHDKAGEGLTLQEQRCKSKSEQHDLSMESQVVLYG